MSGILSENQCLGQPGAGRIDALPKSDSSGKEPLHERNSAANAPPDADPAGREAEKRHSESAVTHRVGAGPGGGHPERVARLLRALAC